jgi:hypothetical protein
MAFPQPHFLDGNAVERVLAARPPEHLVEVTRIRYKNKQQIRKVEKMALVELLDLILRAMEEGHQFGGDMEVSIPALQSTLVGHDGVYWLEPGIPRRSRSDV